MKITGIDISEYQQFKDIKFDFTYPNDFHIVEKRGKPLDKVCFIGQSGTGKTTLLEMIFYHFQKLKYESVGLEKIKIFYSNEYLDKFLYVSDNTTEISLSMLEDVFDVKANEIQNINHILGENENKKNYSLDNIKPFIPLNSLSYIEHIWKSIYQEINEYGLKIQSEFSKIITSTNPKQLGTTFEKVVKWKEKNPDPKIELADKCINPILNKFHLEVDVENLEVPIAIKQKKGIQRLFLKKLSTGTKQILSTAIPIFKLGTTESVILFDEPERSLFPDLQREIIDYYVGLAPDAQFFFATHSPIIAAAFEPCERFILYFDEDGNVRYKNGTAPIGADPNVILSEDFEMMPLINKKGIEKYEEYRSLATQIINEKDETKKEKLISERMKLGNLYNF